MDLIQKLGLLTFAEGRHWILFKNRHILYAVRIMIDKMQNCPKTLLIINFSGQIA